jgi:hypothetical protein
MEEDKAMKLITQAVIKTDATKKRSMDEMENFDSDLVSKLPTHLIIFRAGERRPQEAEDR